MPSFKPIDPEVSLRFGRVLHQLRTEAGLAQETVAQRAGLSRNYYQLLESGLSRRSPRSPANPSLAVIKDLCFALEVPVERLMVEVFREEQPSVEQ